MCKCEECKNFDQKEIEVEHEIAVVEVFGQQHVFVKENGVVSYSGLVELEQDAKEIEIVPYGPVEDLTCALVGHQPKYYYYDKGRRYFYCNRCKRSILVS